MKKAISKAIESIDEEISVLNERKKALMDIDNPNITSAEKWCLLRETPLRSDKTGMLKLAEELIPGADEYIYDVNEVKIRMGRIFVSIPTTRSNTISFSYNGILIKKYPDPEPASKEEVFLKGYLNLLENNASTAALLMYCAPEKNKVSKILFYIFSNKKQLKNTAKVKEEYQKLKDERYERSHKKLDAYTTFGNEVCRFDALMYEKVKNFAGKTFKIERNGIWY